MEGGFLMTDHKLTEREMLSLLHEDARAIHSLLYRIHTWIVAIALLAFGVVGLSVVVALASS
jgi:hypothetical protein